MRAPKDVVEYLEQRKRQQEDSVGKRGARTEDLFVKEEYASMIADKLRRLREECYDKDRGKFLLPGKNMRGEPRGMGVGRFIMIFYLTYVKKLIINKEKTVKPFRDFVANVFANDKDMKIPQRNNFGELRGTYESYDKYKFDPINKKYKAPCGAELSAELRDSFNDYMNARAIISLA